MPTRSQRDLLTRRQAPSRVTEQENLHASFRQALHSGRYDTLVGWGLRDTLRGAAAEAGLDAEVGAIRLALLRLLQEEADPTLLATGVARLTGVAVQAARLRADPDDGLADIRSLLLRELDEHERELAEVAELNVPQEHHHDPD